MTESCQTCHLPIIPAATTWHRESGHVCPTNGRCRTRQSAVGSRQPQEPSTLEALFASLWTGPPYQTQYRFSPCSNHRADVAWPSAALIVELEGHVHRIKDRFESDCVRHNLLTTLGWRYFRVTGKMLRENPEPVLRMIEEALKGGA